MTLETNRPKCCCFTGHRENKLKRSEKEILEDLKQAINQAIDDGYTTFITGMAYGVDIWAGELVLKKRFWNRNIKLIAAIPFAGFESRWNDRWKDRYHKLLNKADEVHYIYYTLDFNVTPHLLRHTYITNLIHEGVDPKTVQYLAGHENSKVTMDIYAKVKYNKPWELAAVVNDAFQPSTEYRENPAS